MAKLDKARNLAYNQWADDISAATTSEELERLLQRAANIEGDEFLREDVAEMIVMHADALGIPFLPEEEP